MIALVLVRYNYIFRSSFDPCYGCDDDRSHPYLTLLSSGAFGEIYKCRWRGTLVAAKIIISAKIRRDWVNKNMMEAIKSGKNVDDAIREIDTMEMEQDEKDQALADFRQEISVLKQLRHPNIVLLLAYSTTENYECLISELMKCSLLDVFKSHMVQGTRMKHKTQIVYATQLSRGMTYLHSCKPPIIHRDLVSFGCNWRSRSCRYRYLT